MSVAMEHPDLPGGQVVSEDAFHVTTRQGLWT
jgi:hypothetical protein